MRTKFPLDRCHAGTIYLYRDMINLDSIDVIVRHEMCEVPKPGDQCLFTGMVSALPDVAQLLMSGRHIDVQKISKESGRSNRDVCRFFLNLHT